MCLDQHYARTPYQKTSLSVKVITAFVITSFDYLRLSTLKQIPWKFNDSFVIILKINKRLYCQ